MGGNPVNRILEGEVVSLDLSSFRKALISLQKGMARATAAPDDKELRDAVIQRFEYTYELSWKMIKRCVEQESPHPAEIDHLSFGDLLRDAAERGLISDVERWMDYREQRNVTSHTYDEEKAAIVYRYALEFSHDAAQLLTALERRGNA